MAREEILVKALSLPAARRLRLPKIFRPAARNASTTLINLAALNNDGQIDLPALGKVQQRWNIGYADGHVLQRGFQRGARIARGDKYA